MTLKSMKSSRNPINRAQIERAVAASESRNSIQFDRNKIRFAKVSAREEKEVNSHRVIVLSSGKSLCPQSNAESRSLFLKVSQ
jgi:hypothetical protein